jgi:hypothetical protein
VGFTKFFGFFAKNDFFTSKYFKIIFLVNFNLKFGKLGRVHFKEYFFIYFGKSNPYPNPNPYVKMNQNIFSSKHDNLYTIPKPLSSLGDFCYFGYFG